MREFNAAQDWIGTAGAPATLARVDGSGESVLGRRRAEPFAKTVGVAGAREPYSWWPMSVGSWAALVVVVSMTACADIWGFEDLQRGTASGPLDATGDASSGGDSSMPVADVSADAVAEIRTEGSGDGGVGPGDSGGKREGDGREGGRGAGGERYGGRSGAHTVPGS